MKTCKVHVKARRVMGGIVIGIFLLLAAFFAGKGDAGALGRLMDFWLGVVVAAGTLGITESEEK